MWAILSDIHGNIEALDAVLADAEAAGAEHFAVLGDTIDHGPDPVACLERVHEVAEVILVGNHDPYRGIRRDHTHTFLGPGAIFFVPDKPCVIHEVAGKEMMVNVGSVGQPRRLGDNRASYVLHDGDTLEFRRVEYDWQTTASKLDDLPIPDEERANLQQRLQTGI